MEWLQQLEHLLEVGGLRNVTLQVMPTSSDAHPGLDGKIELLKFPDGTAVGRSDGAFNGRPITDPKQLRILELRYGTAGRNMIRKTAAEDASELAWFKSSYSSGTDGNSCVEIAAAPHTIHVRDSKHRDTGPQLALTPEAWADFLPYATS